MFKLNKAELKKIFLRPAVYIMLFALSITLVVSAMIYSPATRQNPTTSFGGANETVSMAFSSFKTSSSVDGKTFLDNAFLAEKETVEQFTAQTSPYNQIKTRLADLEYTLRHNDPEKQTLAWALYTFTTLKTSANKQVLVAKIQEVAELGNQLFALCKNGVNSSTIDFYITKAQLDTIQFYAQNLYLSVPASAELASFTDTALIEFADNMKQHYAPISQQQMFDGVTRIDWNAQKTADFLATYYEPYAYELGSQSVLTKIYLEIDEFVQIWGDQMTAEAKKEFNKLTTKYKIASQTAQNLFYDAFYKAKTGGYSDVELRNFIGFENYTTYKLNESITYSTYVLDNGLFSTKYLAPLAYNTTSGYEPSAFDFCLYAMQILSIIITVFAMFFVVSSLAGDFGNGAMKMIATRPISRFGIVGGKTLASINFALIFSVFCLIASLVVGYALYGFGTGEVVGVFNATTPYVVHPAFLLAGYFLNMMLGVIFYVLIAVLLAVILRSNIGALFVSLCVFVGGLIVTSLFVNASWFIYTPFAYLDFFHFLGGASATGGFLAFGLPVGTSILISVIVFVAIIVLLDVISKAIFKARDIT